MIDFSKLTSAVKSVADLAASHASLSALAQDAKDIEAKLTSKLKAEFDATIGALEAKAQSEVDGIVAALEAALSAGPISHAEAAGLTAVATALSAPVSPTQPAAQAADQPAAPVPPVAVGVTADAAPAAPAAPLVPKTVEEYNELRAKGLLP